MKYFFSDRFVRALPPKYLQIQSFSDCLVKYQERTSVHLCFPLQRPETCPPNSWKQFAQEYASLTPGYTQLEGHEECLVITGTSQPMDHCMPKFKKPNCLLQVWQDLQDFDIQSCPSSSPGSEPVR